MRGRNKHVFYFEKLPPPLHGRLVMIVKLFGATWRTLWVTCMENKLLFFEFITIMLLLLPLYYTTLNIITIPVLLTIPLKYARRFYFYIMFVDYIVSANIFLSDIASHKTNISGKKKI